MRDSLIERKIILSLFVEYLAKNYLVQHVFFVEKEKNELILLDRNDFNFLSEGRNA